MEHERERPFGTLIESTSDVTLRADILLNFCWRNAKDDLDAAGMKMGAMGGVSQQRCYRVGREERVLLLKEKATRTGVRLPPIHILLRGL